MPATEPEAERPEGEPGSEADQLWVRAEVSWPCAIALGFGAASLGIFSGLPGVFLALSTLAFLPLYRVQLRADRLLQAFLISLVWMLAVSGAVLGWALETSTSAVARLVPLAERSPPSLGGLEVGLWGSVAWALLWTLGLPFWGLLGLLGVAWLSSLATVRSAESLRQALGAGESGDIPVEPLSLLLGGWPPPLALGLLGTLVLLPVVGRVRPLLPVGGLEERVRRQLEVGVGLAAVGLLLAVLGGGTAG